jgi:hypothetical protein
MSVLLIAYDLGAPDTVSRYENLINRIKSYDDWAKPEYSTWFIKTSKNAATVRSELKPHLYNDDKLLVVNVSDDDWATLRIPSDVTTWMQNNI